MIETGIEVTSAVIILPTGSSCSRFKCNGNAWCTGGLGPNGNTIIVLELLGVEPGYKTKGFDGVERSGQDQLFLGCPRTGVKADSEVLVFVLGGVGSASLDFVGSWMQALILFPW